MELKMIFVCPLFFVEIETYYAVKYTQAKQNYGQGRRARMDRIRANPDHADQEGKNATEGAAQMELKMNIFFSYVDIET